MCVCVRACVRVCAYVREREREGRERQRERQREAGRQTKRQEEKRRNTYFDFLDRSLFCHFIAKHRYAKHTEEYTTMQMSMLN